MSKAIFYTYIILGLLFLGLTVYIYIRSRVNNYVVSFDALLTVLLFYRAYRIYKTKQDGELM